jgi:hypothetical protein
VRLGKELQCRDAPARKRGRRPQPPPVTDLPVLLPQPPGGHGAAGGAGGSKPLPLLCHLPTVLPAHLLPPLQHTLPQPAGGPAPSHHHHRPPPQPQLQALQPTGLPLGVAPPPPHQAVPPSRHHNYHPPHPPPSLSTQPPPLRSAVDASATLPHTHTTTTTAANVSPLRAAANADVARGDDHYRGAHRRNLPYGGDDDDEGDDDDGAERLQRKRMKTTGGREGKGKGESESEDYDGACEGVKIEDEEKNESEGEGGGNENEDGDAPVTRRMMREMEKKLSLLTQLVEMMSGEMRNLRAENHRLRGTVKKMQDHRKQSDQLLAQLSVAHKQQQQHQQQLHHHQQLHHQPRLTDQYYSNSNQQGLNHQHQSPWIVDPPAGMQQRTVQEGFGDRCSLLLAPYSPTHGWPSSLSSSSSLFPSASSSSSSSPSSSSSSPASPPGSHRSLRSSFSFELSVLHAGVSPALLLEAREALPFLCDYDISPSRFAILDLRYSLPPQHDRRIDLASFFFFRSLLCSPARPDRYPICVSINPLSDTPPIMVYVNDAFTSLVGYARVPYAHVTHTTHTTHTSHARTHARTTQHTAN